jgi:ribosome recycling factor
MGTLQSVRAAQLTADERAEFRRRASKAAAEARARLDAVRRDRNLLQRFPSEAEHEKARTSALDTVRASNAPV